jgi:hypothetical protein
MRTERFLAGQEEGRVLKQIKYKFRVGCDIYNGCRVLLNENDVECVALLERENGKKRVLQGGLYET